MSDLSKRLRNVRKEQNLKIKEVANMLSEIGINVTDRTVRRWEAGTAIPSISTIRVLSHIYKTNFANIYEDKKYYKSLNENEYEFILKLRENSYFRKIVSILIKV